MKEIKVNCGCLADDLKELLDKQIANEEELFQNKDLIHVIAEKCKESRFFQGNIEHYYKFTEYIKNESVVNVYIDTLKKIYAMPFWADVILITRIPVIDFLLQRNEV